MKNAISACLKIPERGWVVRDQPQPASNFRRVDEFATCGGWSSTQPRSFFRQALRKLFVGLVVSLWAVTVNAATTNELSLMPWPQTIHLGEGKFRLVSNTQIFADLASRRTAKQLAERLRSTTGFPLRVKTKFFSSGAIPNGILLTTKRADRALGPEGYALTITTKSVVIRAPTQAGLFYGMQTLLQLLPPEIFSTNVKVDMDWQMPCVQIEDWPRFKWRGLMLDVSRHFYTKAEVEKILDGMALYKMNTLHWHLVDDDGWRVQIKKYPRLTQVGAWRKSIGFGLDSNASTAYGPDGRYGGYYTQDDIREVVAYAARRHITIVPEIEMPGHSAAALAAYPQFGSSDKPYTTDRGGEFHMGVFNPADPAAFTFLENVLDEVFKLFPGKYVHIGGDEVPAGAWAKNSACLALMKREGLKNEEELQSWFTKRITKFIVAHGKAPIGWSEIIKGGLATNAAVMDWIGGGVEAASAGHNVVMTPTRYCYFDHYQSLDHSREPRAIGGYLPLRKVYAFEPVPTNLPAQFRSHILGAQGNLWTEYIASLSHVEYMIFPRLCALSEVVWSPKDSRNWDDFVRRLAVNEQRLEELGFNYRRGTSEPMDSPQADSASHATHIAAK
jgi:hexosaminidase